MKSIRQLTREHAAISRIIGRFGRQLGAAESEGQIDGEAFDKLLAFFEEEVDGHHQEKEERIFLPRLLARASGADVQLVRGLHDEHASQRRDLAMIRSNLEGASYGEPNCLRVVAGHARRYVRLHERHARWEETVLFALARRVLDARDDRAILAGFRRLDRMWGLSVSDAAWRVEAWLDQRSALVPI